jgi:hypothetical protein
MGASGSSIREGTASDVGGQEVESVKGAVSKVGDAGKQSRGRRRAGDGFRQPDGILCEILWFLGF